MAKKPRSRHERRHARRQAKRRALAVKERGIRLRAAPSFESLEPRTLLSVSSLLNGSTVTFSGDDVDNDTVYIRTSDTGGSTLLEWRTDETEFDADLDTDTVGIQTLPIAGNTDQTITLTGSDVSFVLSDLALPGVDLEVQASGVDVQAGATISTVSSGVGDDGSITIENTPSITLNDGAVLESGSAAITLSAEVLEQATLGTVSVSASITLNNATVSGGHVSITTDVETDRRFDADGEDIPPFLVDISGFLKEFSIGGGYSKAVADSTITVSGGSIVADSLTMDASASALASTEVFTAIVAAAYAQSDPTATIDFTNGASIVTTHDFDATTSASVDLSVTAKQGLTNFFATSAEKYNFALAIGKGDLVSTTSLSSDSSIQSGGGVSFTSEGDKIIDVEAAAAAGREGVVGLGVAISDVQSRVDSQVDGTVIAVSEREVVVERGEV